MTILLILLGALPYLIGGLLNQYLLSATDDFPSLGLIAFVFLLFWAALACLCNRKGEHTRQVFLCMNVIPTVNLLLIGFQELILHRYWLNIVGAYCQHYFLPVLTWGFRLSNWSSKTFAAFAVCYGLMALAAWLGCKLREPFEL